MTCRPITRLAFTGLVAGALAAIVPIAAADASAHRHHYAHRAHRHAYHQAYRRSAPVFAPGYGSDYDPTPTCRYADGTPYDPDIIGGPNHVGDGGPAVNLGGYDPCGY